MRRPRGGLLLPGLLLTMLAVAGVVILLVVGSPILPRRVPGFPVNARDERRSVPVTPSRSQPAPTRSPSPTPTPTARTSAPTVPPTGDSSADPRTSSSPRPSSKPPTTSKPPVTPTTSPTATPPRCTPGTATLAANADTFVDQASPTQSFGQHGNLLVTSRDKNRNRRTLVRFTLPTIPSACTLRSATLTLTAKEVSGQRLLVARASRAWSEAVTWNTAPSPSGASVAATVSSTTVSWTVTSLVAAQSGRSNYGFVVRAATENAQGAGQQTNLVARTSSSGPKLVLRWS